MVVLLLFTLNNADTSNNKVPQNLSQDNAAKLSFNSNHDPVQFADRLHSGDPPLLKLSVINTIST